MLSLHKISLPIAAITRNPENVLIGRVHVFDNFTCMREYVFVCVSANYRKVNYLRTCT